MRLTDRTERELGRRDQAEVDERVGYAWRECLTTMMHVDPEEGEIVVSGTRFATAYKGELSEDEYEWEVEGQMFVGLHFTSSWFLVTRWGGELRMYEQA